MTNLDHRSLMALPIKVPALINLHWDRDIVRALKSPQSPHHIFEHVSPPELVSRMTVEMFERAIPWE